MAMKNCKECGAEISSSAKVCPKCGKKQKMSKKLIGLVVIILLIIVVSTSGGNNGKSVQTSGTNSVQSDAVSSNQDVNTVGEGEIGKYHVKIGEHQITKDYAGKSILLVKIAFTNNNDVAKAFMYNLDCKAYQAGVELTMPISAYGIDNYNWEDKTKEIQSGVTYEFNLAFEISDTSKPVDLEIAPAISSKYSQKVTKTIEL